MKRTWRTALGGAPRVMVLGVMVLGAMMMGAVVLGTMGCGPSVEAQSPGQAPNGAVAIGKAGPEWAAVSVHVPSSLAALNYRAPLIDALHEAGVTVTDSDGPAVLKLDLTPATPGMSMSGGFGASVTMHQRLNASLFHQGRLVDRFSASKDVKVDGIEAMNEATQVYAWLARTVVQQLLASPKVAAVAASAASTSTVAAKTPGAAPEQGLVAGTPQAAAHVFVVGIERYRDLPAPTGARADAEAFAAVAKTTFGVSGDRLRVALDDRATAADIRRGLKWLAESTPAGGRAYFYFSGHGAPNPTTGASYLVPFDGDPLALDETGLPLDDVMAKLGGGKAREALVVLDSCFSGAGGRSVLPQGTRPLVRVKSSSVPGTVALLTASTGAETSGATAAGDRGLFTTHLVDALGRAQADIDGDAQITLAELMQWVEPRVARGAKDAGREQHPALVVGGGGAATSFVVAHGLAR